MGLKITNILKGAILWSYFALALATPLLFSTKNSELFEIPKMLFVYFFAGAILTLTGLDFILKKEKKVPTGPVIITLVIFTLVQIASTSISIDKFTSIFGYPTRLNGGLLSQFAFLIIFSLGLVNLTKDNAKKILTAVVFSAFAVALWGIPSHFGYDPNCLVLTGKLNANCWQIDFNPTLRIFSTMGQPNWLASYLILVLPISMAFALSVKKQTQKLLFGIISISLFLALIFTNSRAGIAGFVVSIILFFALSPNKIARKNSRALVVLFLVFLTVMVFLAKPLYGRIAEIINPPKNAPTDSTQIRLIVWKGAIDVIKNNPLLGTGPETFAYSYYQYRPLEHNKTTEWNFFYNKAHNEFLNIFANVGILGGLSSLAFLAATIFVLRIKKQDEQSNLFASATISALVGYQLSIFFGFSTVATQLTMFMEIATVLVLQEKTQIKTISLKFLKGPLQWGSIIITLFIGTYVLFFVFRLYMADILITRAKSLNSTSSLLVYTDAITTSPSANPFYLSEAAYAFAAYAISLKDPTSQKTFAASGADFANIAQRLSPKNILITRKLATTYILLSNTDANYQKTAQELGETIVKLAPTDPQSYLSLAKVQIALDQKSQAKTSVQKALELKPDYLEAQQLLNQLTTN